MSFILTGTSMLRPPSLLTDEPLLATMMPGSFSAGTGVCCSLSSESFSRARSIEKRILTMVQDMRMRTY